MEPHEQQPFLEPKKAEDTGNKAQQPPTHVSSPYSKKRQVLATVCATLGCLLNGAVIGFTGPAIPSLMNQTDTGGYTIWNSPIKLTPSDASWITGLLSIGCFVGCITAGPVMEKFGRRITLLGFTSSLYFTGFAFILLGENAAMVFLGRFLDGMGLGLYWPLLQFTSWKLQPQICAGFWAASSSSWGASGSSSYSPRGLPSTGSNSQV